MSKLGSKVSDTFVADLTNGFVNTAQTGIVLVTFTDADTTPTVAGSNSFLASNTGATSITNFDDGVEGQAIRVHFTNANTTLVHDVTKIKLSGGANVTPAANTALAFTRDTGGVWWQVGSAALVFNDGADPSVSNPGDVGDPGNDAFPARRDHVHEREEATTSAPFLFDDFIGSVDLVTSDIMIMDRYWQIKTSGTSGFGAFADPDGTAVGVIRGFAGTASTDAASISTQDIADVAQASFSMAQHGLKVKFRFRIDSSDFTHAMLYLGLTDDASQPSSGTASTSEVIFGIWATGEALGVFDYATVNDGSIAFFECKDAGTQTYDIISSTIPGIFDDWHTVTLEIVNDNLVNCYVDDVLETTLTTNLPDPSVPLYLRASVHTRFSVSGPGASSKIYLDAVKIDGPDMDRGI